MLQKFKIASIAILVMLAILALNACDNGTSPKVKEPETDSGYVQLLWQGARSAAPANAAEGYIYYNTGDGKTYIYTGGTWQVFALNVASGPQGPVGAKGADGNDGITPHIGTNGNWFFGDFDTGVLAEGTAGSLNSVLSISPEGFWEIDGVETHYKAAGPQGASGTQLVWKGNAATHPAGAEDGWLYYNTAAKASYIYLNGAWNVFANDGAAGPQGPAGQNGAGSVSAEIVDGELFINGVSIGFVGSSESGGGGEIGDPESCEHTGLAPWRLVLPMPNIVSLLEEQYCADCGEVVGKRYSRKYTSLTNWLKAQTGGTTVNSPIELAVSISLGDTSGDTGGWGDLLYAIDEADKYVSLDLTYCTITGTNFRGSVFTAGKVFVVSIIYPYAAQPAASIISTPVSLGFTNLKSVTGYGDVGAAAFYDCTSLTQVSFPQAASILQSAFENCTSITEVSFPNVTTIQETAFFGCANLEKVSFPQATIIRGEVFKDCISLKQLYFPKVITLLDYGSGVFNGCISLEKVIFPNLTTFTGNPYPYTSGNFNGCISLTEVSFPNAAYIPVNTFKDCTALEFLYIPLVRSIGEDALTGCEELEHITIARNCTISVTGQSARAADFITYYESVSGGNKAMGTYVWNGTAWTGAF